MYLIGGIAASALALAAGVAQAGLAGSAEPSRDRVVIHELVYEQPADRTGKPLGARRLVFEGEHDQGVPAFVVSSDGSRATARRATVGRGRVRRLEAASGCKTVTAVKEAHSFLFRSLLWRYTGSKYFCWTFPRVTGAQTTATPCCTDPTWFWVGPVGAGAYFFSWSGDGHGGHYSYRQGRFEQRVLGTPIDSAQPLVAFRTYGDGSWTYQTSS